MFHGQGDLQLMWITVQLLWNGLRGFPIMEWVFISHKVENLLINSTSVIMRIQQIQL